MLNLFTRKKKELERLQTAYSECYAENVKLRKKIATLEQDVSDATSHLVSVCLINGALMDVLTDDQKVVVGKNIKKTEKKLTKKKGKKNVKKAKRANG